MHAELGRWGTRLRDGVDDKKQTDGEANSSLSPLLR